MKEQEKNQTPITEAEKKKVQQEIQKHFNKFKKRMKTMSKSELVAILWEQGMEYKRLQDIAQELFEENKSLKEKKNVEDNPEKSE